MSNYNIVYALATKQDNARGRASGGIMIFINKNKKYHFQVMSKNPNYIILEIKLGSDD